MFTQQYTLHKAQNGGGGKFRWGAEVGLEIVWWLREEKCPNFSWSREVQKPEDSSSRLRQLEDASHCEHADHSQCPVLAKPHCHRLTNGKEMVVSTGRSRRRQQSISFARINLHKKSLLAFFYYFNIQYNTRNIVQIFKSIRGDEATRSRQS